jgi:peptidoglycan/LPS O-acetylase OafA/YrhL
MPQTSQRVPELDSLRGVAALTVLLWHYAAHFHAAPLSNLLRPLYMAGPYAVDFFFVLSGFVLSRVYLVGKRPSALSTNVARRIARMYPLHFLTLLVVAGCQGLLGLYHCQFAYHHNDYYHFLLNLLLIQQLGFQRAFSFNGPSWSISTEFFINLLFFVMIYLWPRRVRLFACGAIGSAFLLAVTGDGRIVRDDFLVVANSNLFRTMLGFSCGVLLSRLPGRSLLAPSCEAAPPGRSPSATRRSVGYMHDGIGVVIVGCVIPSLLQCKGALRASEFTLVIVCFPLVIWSAVSGNLFRVILSWRPFVYIGVISYSIYMMHFPVQLAFYMMEAFGCVTVNYDRASTLLLFVALTLGVSSITYRFVEIPCQRRINGWWGRRRVCQC